MSSKREKAVDEIFCRSCGEAIKEEAEICPECGVRNKEANSPSSRASTSNTPSTVHDPSQYSTTVSDTWWYGVAGCTIVWAILLAIASSIGEEGGAFLGLILVVVWVGLPLSAYFDMKYIRANGKWNPNSVLWVIALSIWLVNVVAGGIYLYRRHEVLGEP